MTTPNRFVIVGDSKVVAKVKVRDQVTNEEFNGELRFNAMTSGVETTDRENANVNFKIIADKESKTMWELVVFDQLKENDPTLKTLGLSSERFDRYVAKLQKTTKYSKEQIHKFINVLVKRFEELSINSLDELFIRYSSINSINSSDQVELLKETAGVFHLANLKCLMEILKSEGKSKEMIEHWDKLIQREQEKKSKFDHSSEEYRLIVENELRWLNNKKMEIERLK